VTAAGRGRRGRRLFGLLLQAYPRPFRRRYGDEMREVFAERRRDELRRAGRRGVLRLWARTVVDVATSAAAARLADLAARRGARRARGPAVAGGATAMSKLWQDLKYAWRTLRQAPGFTVVAVLTLGLGIGANTAVFSVIDAVLLRPLPFPHPERLVTLWERELGGATMNTSYANFLDWRQRSRTFDAMAVLSYWTPSIAGSGAPERLEGLRVSRDFFRVLGVRPALGRDFLAEEDVRGHHHVAIVSYGLWQRRLGGDPRLIGRAVLLDGVPYTLVGVLPKGLESPFSTNFYRTAEIWAPLAYNSALPFACRTCRHLRAIARLGPGVSPERAGQQLDAVSRALVAEYPHDYERAGAAVIPLGEQLVGDYRHSLLLLMGAVGLVLAIACANVTSLLLARSQRRTAELAVRSALGAHRTRIVRQLLTESALLHLLGGALGALLAAAGVAALVHASPPNVPRLQLAAVDLRVMAVTFAVSLLAGLAVGLVPALRCSGGNLRAGLASGGAGGVVRRRRLDGLLVTGDMALALVLLIGAGLVLQSLVRLFAVHPGFDPRRMLTAEISASGPRYAADASVVELYRRVLDRVQALPGVRAAALASQLPLGGNFDSYGITLEENPNAGEAERPSAQRFSVSAGYRAVMGIPLLRGRDLAATDQAGTPAVVLVNRTFAERIWPGQEALGKRIRLGDPKGPWRTVVGVVGDVHHLGLDVPADLQIYLPQPQFMSSDMTLVVRCAAEPLALAAAVRAAIWAVDPDRAVSNVATMDEVMQVSAARRLFTLRLMAVFAAIAVLLAMVGIYGVLSYAVGERTREIGVRMALGAPRGRIVAMVVGRGALYAAAGLLLGTALAAATSHLLSALLFGVSAQDPATYAGLALLLALMALLAAWLPARRAAALDPLAATRSL
jgi:putative ABC transport system permease protein